MSLFQNTFYRLTLCSINVSDDDDNKLCSLIFAKTHKIHTNNLLTFIAQRQFGMPNGAPLKFNCRPNWFFLCEWKKLRNSFALYMKSIQVRHNQKRISIFVFTVWIMTFLWFIWLHLKDNLVTWDYFWFEGNGVWPLNTLQIEYISEVWSNESIISSSLFAKQQSYRNIAYERVIP